jgi:hypothetical protein
VSRLNRVNFSTFHFRDTRCPDARRLPPTMHSFYACFSCSVLRHTKCEVCPSKEVTINKILAAGVLGVTVFVAGCSARTGPIRGESSVEGDSTSASGRGQVNKDTQTTEENRKKSSTSSGTASGSSTGSGGAVSGSSTGSGTGSVSGSGSVIR